jgi:hypothetical protein
VSGNEGQSRGRKLQVSGFGFQCWLLRFSVPPGGYDAIAAVADSLLLPRLQADPQLARFWQHRGEDGLKREKQRLVGFLCSSTGGPLYYTGRE